MPKPSPIAHTGLLEAVVSAVTCVGGAPDNDREASVVTIVLAETFGDSKIRDPDGGGWRDAADAVRDGMAACELVGVLSGRLETKGIDAAVATAVVGAVSMEVCAIADGVIGRAVSRAFDLTKVAIPKNADAAYISATEPAYPAKPDLGESARGFLARKSNWELSRVAQEACVEVSRRTMRGDSALVRFLLAAVDARAAARPDLVYDPRNPSLSWSSLLVSRPMGVWAPNGANGELVLEEVPVV